MNDRKLDIGATISQAFSIYGSQAGVLLPVAFAIFLIAAVINGILAESFILFPLVFAISMIASTLYAGTVVQLVSDVQDGRRDSSAGELISSATPFILPLIGAGILAGLGIGLGLILLVVPGLFLLTIWCVIAPAIVVEKKGVLEAFGRSRDLVRGNGWQVFGVIVVVFAIVLVVNIVLSAVALGIDDSVAMRILFNVISETITAPVAALVAAVLYFKLRALEGDVAQPVAPTQQPAPTDLPPGATTA